MSAVANAGTPAIDHRPQATADQPLPIADFFRPALFRAPELNAAGTHVAALVSTDKDRVDLLVYDLAKAKGERINAGANRDIASFDWQDDERLVFSVSEGKLYAFGLFGVELAHLGKIKPLNLGDAVQVVSFPKRERLHPYVWILKGATDDQDRMLVQLDSERSVSRSGATTLASGTVLGSHVLATVPRPSGGDPIGYLADADGEIAYGFTARNGVRKLHRLAGTQWRESPLDLDRIDVLARGEAPGELVVRGPRQEGRPRPLQIFDATGGVAGRILHQDERYDPDVDRIFRRAADDRLLGFRHDRRYPETVWFDDGLRTLQADLERALPGFAVAVLGFDRTERQMLVAARSDRQPTRYYHYDREQKALKLIAAAGPWIDPARMHTMKGLAFKSRDGTELEGYLTLPDQTSASNPPPLVVLPHGGPWVRDTWGWDPEVQFLASRGYAVFQPNYRGSRGYDWRFAEADLWDFRKMHDDVTDGVKALIAARLVDPTRVAIMGSSFGGYLAVCGVAFEPGLYRCAITVAGVFDWAQVMKEERWSAYHPAAFGVLRRNLGDPKTQQARFEAISPLRKVNQIAVPVFVAHGREDLVAAVEQSERLVSLLRRSGVPHETHFASAEGHGFQRLENQVALYSELEQFLARNLATK